MNRRRTTHRGARQWLPAGAAGLLLAAVVGVGVVFGDGGSSGAEGTVEPAPVAPAGVIVEGFTIPADPATAPPVASSAAVEPLTAPLVMGSTGEDVRRVQQRLSEIGFQPGPADGQFGSATQQAVWAYKKLVGNITWDTFTQRNDQTTVTDELWQQMADPSVRILPRRPGSGTHVEVYLPLQVLAVFTDDNAIFVSHISSGELGPDGEPATFCETATYDTDEYGNLYPEPVTKQVCAESKSPGGVFRFDRHVDGKRISPLGGLKNPWYFNFGIAIHGAYNVPTQPASHGCIRISNPLADVFPGLVARGDQVFVWGHDGKDPEQYSERESQPSFNRPDPDATTTTTTTTLPTTTTTTAPAPPTTVANAQPATTTATTTAAPTTTAAATTTTVTPTP